MKSAAVTAVLLLAAAGVYAQPRGGGACRADVEKLCADVEREPGAIGKCLEENKSALSDSCKAEQVNISQKISRKKAEMTKAKSVCKADIEQYCPKSGKNERATMGCLAENRAALSADCAALLKEMRPKRKTATSGEEGMTQNEGRATGGAETREPPPEGEDAEKRPAMPPGGMGPPDE